MHSFGDTSHGAVAAPNGYTPAVTGATGLRGAPLELCGWSHLAASCSDQHNQGECSELLNCAIHTIKEHLYVHTCVCTCTLAPTPSAQCHNREQINTDFPSAQETRKGAQVDF